MFFWYRALHITIFVNRCAFCNLEVRGWEPGDTAEGEHRRWNPNCLFINKNLHVGDIKIGQEIISNKENDVCGRSPSSTVNSHFTPAPNLNKCKFFPTNSIQIIMVIFIFRWTPFAIEDQYFDSF